MRRTTFRALVPALALTFALAAGVRAECADEIALDSDFGQAVLLTSYERTEEIVIPFWIPSTGGQFVLTGTLTSEYGVYQLSDGSRVTVECSATLDWDAV